MQKLIKVRNDTYIYGGDVDAVGNPTGWGEAVLADITMAESSRWQKDKGTWLNGRPEGIVKITYFSKEKNFAWQEMYRDRVHRFGRGTHYENGMIWNYSKGRNDRENITKTPARAYYCPKGMPR